MQYQDCAIEVQADETEPCVARPFTAASEPFWVATTINPLTGLSTDYLNHFNEAIMMFEMFGTCPDFLNDIHGWQPMSYRDHVLESELKDRDLAIAAYADADPAARARLDTLASTMTTMIEATRLSIAAGVPPQTAGDLAARAAQWLKPLVARAGAVINGAADSSSASVAGSEASHGGDNRPIGRR